jgi:hypothetical protein
MVGQKWILVYRRPSKVKKILLTLLLIVFIASCFLLGVTLTETARCTFLEREYPNFIWEVKLFRCYAFVNGSWLDADRFQHMGMSP